MSWLRRSRFLFPLLALSLSTAPAVAQQTATVQGRVTNEQGEAVAGARVQLLQSARSLAGAVTSASGRYVIPRVPVGSYTVRVDGLGYHPAERSVQVSASEALDFRLEAAPIALDGLNVVGVARGSTPVAAIPGSVTLIGRAEVEEQAKLSPNLGEILSRTVPGLSAGNQSMSIYGQALRGRNVAVLIDGVPQSTSRNVMRDFSTIDPSMIERVEVLRGATSVYGDGATGGVINIITRAGSAGSVRFSTEIGAETSLSNAGTGIGPRLVQSVSGEQGGMDYVLSGSLSRTGAFYDAEGDLIPSDPHGQGGVAEMNSWNLLGKVGRDFGSHRLQMTASHYQSQQYTEYVSDPSVTEFEPGTRKAQAIAGLDIEDNQGGHNTVASLAYQGADVLGSQVRSQLYYRDYLTRFSAFDGRRWYGDVMQTFVASEKVGGRMEVETPLPSRMLPSLVWGVDYTDENTSQPATVFDPAAYDESGGRRYAGTGERLFAPPVALRSLGLFAQAAATPVEGWLVRGGVRHERAQMAVDDFTSVVGTEIIGGALNFDPVLFNLGTVVDLTSAVGVYANYSEGFSLADVGRALRFAPDGTRLGDQATRPQEVEQYELGLRGTWSALQATIAAFRNESDLGINLDKDLRVVRSPERVYGVEATLDAQPTSALAVGGTFSWSEGESYVEKTGEWVPLNGWRIQPAKATAHAQHQTLPGWSNRLQVLYSGDRDRAFVANDRNPVGNGVRPVESYWVMDYLGALQVGPGTLHLGVHNLLNRQYFSTASQLLLSWTNTSFAAARGATLSVGYSINY